jgi:hypothetical protein
VFYAVLSAFYIGKSKTHISPFPLISGGLFFSFAWENFYELPFSNAVQGFLNGENKY